MSKRHKLMILSIMIFIAIAYFTFGLLVGIHKEQKECRHHAAMIAALEAELRQQVPEEALAWTRWEFEDLELKVSVIHNRICFERIINERPDRGGN